MAPAIEFHGVNKWFGKLHVLRGIELAVETGEVPWLEGGRDHLGQQRVPEPE